jgi:hypothetical protein
VRCNPSQEPINAALAPHPVAAMNPTPNPRVPYWRVWRDAEGISHQHRALVENFEVAHLAEGMQSIWRTPTQQGCTGIVVIKVEPDVDYGWHENPVPQWIVPLSGRWFVQTMDGHRVEMGPGELSFGGDQGCLRTDGRLGHRAGALDGEPAYLMLIQLERIPPKVASAS